MAKSRFSKRKSALEPGWILDGPQSGSVTPTTTSNDQNQSLPPSSEEQHKAAAPASQENNDPTASKVDPSSAHNVYNASLPTSQLPCSHPPGQKKKSRYSKSHASGWTLSSAEADPDTQSTKIAQGTAKVMSWTRKFIGANMSIKKPDEMPSPKSMVPPAPTQMQFPAQVVLPHIRGNRFSNSTSQSPNSGADVPARVPYVASGYTPNCSPDYNFKAEPQSQGRS
ncbi:hypothetical protein GQ44DRAFT_774605 [Phaeosphaeriaceae sp. PMI808]|nr:hypothetical protein GQ44DRAFT_774605 [Phaeosphaeriaceae sp. PMI808]